LSDREQQLLEQMELALSAEDPRFANQMRGGAARARRRDWILGGVGTLVGLAVVLLGVTQRNMWIGGAGFALMVAAVLFAVTPRKARGLAAVRADGTTGPRTTKGATTRPKRQAGFMDRLEERWDRRRDHGW
jgi:hypothetical protein